MIWKEVGSQATPVQEHHDGCGRPGLGRSGFQSMSEEKGSRMAVLRERSESRGRGRVAALVASTADESSSSSEKKEEKGEEEKRGGVNLVFGFMVVVGFEGGNGVLGG